MRRKLAARARSGNDTVPTLARRRPTRRPLRVEVLEDRRMLALLTVNSVLDIVLPNDGLVTLREAITAANTDTLTDLGQKGFGVDIIEFDPVVFGTPRVIQLALGELNVTQSLTINGPGHALLSIDAQQTSRIFNFSVTLGNHTIAGITLTGGKATGEGGAVRSQSNLTVDASVIRGNTATGRGGGIFCGPGDLSITNSTITGNSTTGSFGNGGGVFANRATVTNSTLTDNQTSGNNAHGGGLYGVRHVELAGSTISGNRTLGSGVHGGGLHAYSVKLTNTTVTDNRAAGSGGGFLAAYAATLTDSTISNNMAAMSGGGFRVAGFLNFVGTATLTNSQVSGNQATDGGGFSAGFATVTDSTISGNTASGFGGGFHVAKQGVLQPAMAVVVRSAVTGNTAASGGGFYANNGAALERSSVSNNMGGGIFALYGDVTVTASTISGNQRTLGGGGGIFARYANVTLESSTINGNSAMGAGGGIRSYESVAVRNSTISGNTASVSGGGIYARRDPLRPYVGTLTISHSTIAGNHAASGTGGGIWKAGGQLDLSATIVAENTAGDGNPDLQLGQAAVDLQYVLVGNKLGTALTEAQTPDARGNLIGSSTGGGTIDPKLGPLADNGGPTKTRALLPGSPAVDAIPFTVPRLPTHDYQLNGALTDALGGPELVAMGGTLTAAGYEFGPNQGLNLSSALAAPGTYSIELDFRWDALPGGWQKIIDFHHLTSDVGLYTADDGLHFLDRAFVAELFVPDVMHRVVLTRDDATDVVRAYVNGVQAWSFVDAAGDAVFNTTNRIIRFFQDDHSSGQQEAQSGLVDRIRIYDVALTATEVAVLSNPITVPQFDQRGDPFSRILDGDGIQGAFIDIGAYEAALPATPAGDFNHDGFVDAADYVLWRNGLGTSFTPEDYGVWRNNFGSGPMNATASAFAAEALAAAVDLEALAVELASREARSSTAPPAVVGVPSPRLVAAEDQWREAGRQPVGSLPSYDRRYGPTARGPLSNESSLLIVTTAKTTTNSAAIDAWQTDSSTVVDALFFELADEGSSACGLAWAAVNALCAARGGLL